MKHLRMLGIALALAGSMASDAQQPMGSGPMRASRSSALMGAKNLTVTSTTGTTYYYLVSSNDTQMMRLSEDSVQIGNDGYAKSKIKRMRFRPLMRRLLDGDSLTYDKTATLDHGLVALRRNFNVGEWNSVVLPFELTGPQVRDAFGEEAELAIPRGISEEDETIVEFQHIDLHTTDVAMKANYHYLIRPSKEADVAETGSLSGLTSVRVKGPFYLFPNISIRANQTPRNQLFKNDEETTQVRFRSSYTALDGSGTRNKKVQPEAYTLDDDTHTFTFHEDSVAVGAFRSWILDISEERKALKFYVDGVELTDGIAELKSETWRTEKENNGIYDLGGRRVAAPTRKGIYIVNGRKVVIK